MLKRKQKCRIKLNESINEKLDNLSEIKSTDVYKPTDDVKDDNFLNLVGDEVYFELTDVDINKSRKDEKIGKLRNKVINILVILIVSIGFLIYLGTLVKIII